MPREPQPGARSDGYKAPGLLRPNLGPSLATNLAPNLAPFAPSLLITSLAGLSALAWLQLAPARAESDFRARVVSIGDGDTIRVQHGDKLETIRLACIDAPEMAQVPYGDQARRYLQIRLPLQRQVTIHPLNTDRYGRTVAEVIGDINLNLALVEDGQAFVYPKYLRHCDAREYLNAEYRASRHRFGIWRVPGGIERPWMFRHGRQQERQQERQQVRQQERQQGRLQGRKQGRV
jgi:endonuclease YncB( thermonuclease family)